MQEDNSQPPKTVAEIGVHIFYINRRLEAIDRKLDDSPTRKEFDDLKDSAVKKSDIKDILTVWNMLTSTLGKIIVGAFVVVLLTAAYHFVTNQVPQFFTSANSSK